MPRVTTPHRKKRPITEADIGAAYRLRKAGHSWKSIQATLQVPIEHVQSIMQLRLGHDAYDAMTRANRQRASKASAPTIHQRKHQQGLLPSQARKPVKVRGPYKGSFAIPVKPLGKKAKADQARYGQALTERWHYRTKEGFSAEELNTIETRLRQHMNGQAKETQ